MGSESILSNPGKLWSRTDSAGGGGGVGGGGAKDGTSKLIIYAIRAVLCCCFDSHDPESRMVRLEFCAPGPLHCQTGWYTVSLHTFQLQQQVDLPSCASLRESSDSRGFCGNSVLESSAGTRWSMKPT